MNSDMGITRMDPPEEDITLGYDATRRPESTGGPTASLSAEAGTGTEGAKSL